MISAPWTVLEALRPFYGGQLPVVERASLFSSLIPCELGWHGEGCKLPGGTGAFSAVTEADGRGAEAASEDQC